MTTYTKSQIKALTYAFAKGGAVYAPHTLIGGAFHRCIERLAKDGLLAAEPPFGITMRGLVALRDIRSKRYADSGCMAYLDDLRAVEAALAQFPSLAARAA